MQTLEEYIKEKGSVIKASEALNIERTHCYALLKNDVIIHNDEIYPKMTRRKKIN